MATTWRPPPLPDAGSDPQPANDVGGDPPRPLTPEQDALVKAGLPDVMHAAGELARRYKNRFTPEDMLAPGTIGLIEAARGYEAERHPSFRHYARYYILGRMLNAVDTELFSRRARVEHAMERAFCKFEVHQILDIDLFADPEEVLLDGARAGCDDALAAALVAALVEAEAASPEDAILMRISLRDGLAKLYPHELQVIRLVYERDMTLAEAARELGVHTNTAQNRHASALRKLRKLLVDT